MDDKNYLSMRSDVNATCDSFSKNRTVLYDNLVEKISNIEGINYGSSSDTVTTRMNANLEACQQKYQLIKDTASTVLKKVEDIYISLKNALDDLEEVQKLYEDVLASEPVKPAAAASVKSISVLGTDETNKNVVLDDSISLMQAYRIAKQEWENKKKEIFDRITALQSKIASYNDQLSQINNSNSLDAYISVSSNIVIKPYVPLTTSELKSLNYRQAVYDSTNELLKGKTSLDELSALLHYTKEETIENLVKYRANWYCYCDLIPDNIAEIIKINETEFSGDKRSYLIKNDFNMSDYNVYKSNVDIGGKSFEFVQMFDKSKRGFVYDLNNYTSKGNIINNLASYSSKMFDTLTQKDHKILLVDDFQKTMGYNYLGGTHIVNYNKYILTVITQSYPVNSLFVSDHEFSHSFDNNLFLDNANSWYSVNNQNKLMEIFRKEYKKISSFNNHGYIYNDLKDIKELFAETASIYLEYPDEMRDYAPGLYSFYHNLYGDRLKVARSIKDVGSSKVVRASSDVSARTAQYENVTTTTNKSTATSGQKTSSNKSSGVNVTVGKTSKVSNNTVNVDENTKLKTSTEQGEKITIGNDNNTNKQTSTSIPKEEKQERTQVASTVSDGSVVINEKPSSKKEKPLNVSETREQTSSKESVTSGNTSKPQSDGVYVDEKVIQKESTNDGENKNVESTQNTSQEPIIIEEPKDNIRTIQNADGSVTVNISKASSDETTTDTEYSENTISAEKQNNYETSYPIRTQYNPSNGTVTIFMSDGTMKIVKTNNGYDNYMRQGR